MAWPTAQYLHPIAGLDAAIWVPPSRGQLFWVRRAPALFAPALGTGRGLTRWWVIATVTPSTNVTGLNLAYQSYLNHVFHRTRLARVGHAACMPFIVTALLALLYPVHAVLPGALALAAWWAYWAVKERDPVWGACAVGLAAALYPLAQALGRLGAADLHRLAQPWALLLLAGFLQAGSHVLEPLPPRVTRSVHWIPPAEYLLGPTGHHNPPGTAARRAGQLTAQAVFGTVDEIVASPRLLPVLLLELLWLFGHDPVRRAAWRALSARAIANGNPALDYIGTGGPTPLCAPLKRQGRPVIRPRATQARKAWVGASWCRGGLWMLVRAARSRSRPSLGIACRRLAWRWDPYSMGGALSPRARRPVCHSGPGPSAACRLAGTRVWEASRRGAASSAAGRSG